jgi:hypothetical protein
VTNYVEVIWLVQLDLQFEMITFFEMELLTLSISPDRYPNLSLSRYLYGQAATHQRGADLVQPEV